MLPLGRGLDGYYTRVDAARVYSKVGFQQLLAVRSPLALDGRNGSRFLCVLFPHALSPSSLSAAVFNDTPRDEKRENVTVRAGIS